MSIRKLEFLISSYGIEPNFVVQAGRQYEHNATAVDFIIPKELYELLSNGIEAQELIFRIDATDAEGGYHPSQSLLPMQKDDKYILSYDISYDITSVGGICKLTVIASKIDNTSNCENMIFCSAPAILEFETISRNVQSKNQFERELGGILNEAKGYMIEAAAVDDSGKLYVRYVNGKTVYVGVSNLLSTDTITAAINATDSANIAAEKAMDATQKANTAAEDAAAVRQEVEEGGFIESLKETNAGNKFTFWVGTKAEYEALTEIVENCFYLITDDTTTEDLKKYGKVLWNSSVTQDYSKFADVLSDITNYSVIKAKMTYGLLAVNLINVLCSLDEITENDDTGNKTYLYSGNTTYYGNVGALGDTPKTISYGITLTLESKPDGATTGTVKVYSVYFDGDGARHGEITEDITLGREVIFTQIIGVC